MKRSTGDVDVDPAELAAKCRKCGKAIAYVQPQPLAAWNKVLKEFMAKHRQCLLTPTLVP